MTKLTATGEPVYPDLSVQISIQSYSESSTTLTKKMRSLIDSTFGESETLVTEIQTFAKKVGKLTQTRVVFSVEVYYPKN